jgi:hypothetical protein
MAHYFSAARKFRSKAFLAIGLLPLVDVAARGQITHLNTFATAGGNPGQVANPIGISVSPNGQEVLVTSLGSSGPGGTGPTGVAFAGDGTFQFDLVAGGSAGVPNNALQSAIGTDGTFYAANTANSGMSAVSVYAPDGEGESEFSVTSDGRAEGLALNPTSGLLYIVLGSNGIEVNHTDGTATGQTIGTARYDAVAVNSSQSIIYGINNSTHLVDEFNSAGNSLGSIGSGNLSGPSNIAVSATGQIYVVDGNAIKLFSPSGTFDGTIISTSPAGGPFIVSAVAVGPTGYIYVAGQAYNSQNVGTPEADRYFDPSQWVSGTNNFTNSQTGPTSVSAGGGVNDLLGATITLNANMGLVVGNTTTVDNGGIFNVTGGSLTTPALAVDGANFTMTGGTLITSGITVSNGGIADITQAVAASVTGTVTVADANSQFKVDSGATVTVSALSNAGQVVIGTTADLIAFNSTANSGTIDLAGGTLDIRGTLTNSASRTIQGAGTITTTAGLVNNGTLALAGSSNVLGPVTNNGTGTIHLSGTQPNVFFGAVDNEGALDIDAGASGTFYGPYTGAGSVNDMGVLYFNANSIAGPITGGGIVNLGTPANPTVLHLSAQVGTSVISGLNINANSSLDLANSDLILKNTTVGTLLNDLKAGFNAGHGYWNGTGGIVSTTAAADTGFLTTIGYRSGGSSFNGINTTSNDVLVKYTYYGDADLNGAVNGADYQQIDLGFGMHLTGWSNGDFNYDGVVDGSDYALIDNTFNQLTATGAAPLALIAEPAAMSVPEPGEWGLLGLGCMALLAPKRRRTATSIAP